MSRLSADAARAMIEREAFLLDVRRWEEWLTLYDEKAVFWVPGWRNQFELVTDPEQEVSLIYIADRASLADRVWRIESGRSIASTPILRTTHSITGVIVENTETADSQQVHASWTCHVYDPKHRKQHVFFGRYEFDLVDRAQNWVIAKKKVHLLNDYIPTMIDFYCV